MPVAAHAYGLCPLLPEALLELGLVLRRLDAHPQCVQGPLVEEVVGHVAQTRIVPLDNVMQDVHVRPAHARDHVREWHARVRVDDDSVDVRGVRDGNLEQDAQSLVGRLTRLARVDVLAVQGKCRQTNGARRGSRPVGVPNHEDVATLDHARLAPRLLRNSVVEFRNDKLPREAEKQRAPLVRVDLSKVRPRDEICLDLLDDGLPGSDDHALACARVVRLDDEQAVLLGMLPAHGVAGAVDDHAHSPPRVQRLPAAAHLHGKVGAWAALLTPSTVLHIQAHARRRESARAIKASGRGCGCGFGRGRGCGFGRGFGRGCGPHGKNPGLTSHLPRADALVVVHAAQLVVEVGRGEGAARVVVLAGMADVKRHVDLCREEK